jgi:hypothetical protein
MGGAIVLMLHRKEHTFWDGAILVAPMCKVTFQQFVFFSNIFRCIGIFDMLSIVVRHRTL